ncbi:hypothetical protein ACT4XO_15715 [Acinetobacter baumannii]
MLRNASIKDLDFLFNEILEGSKSGHFNSEFHQNPRATAGLRVNLESILSGNGRVDGPFAYGLVLENNNGKPVSFLLISALEGNKGNEFWMLSTAKPFRKQGFGNQIIDEVLNAFKARKVGVTARCSPESEIMYQMLIKKGFKHLETGPQGTRFLAIDF